MEEKGAVEIIINSIEKDGLMGGYDIELICTVSDAVTIPVVSLGGAGTYTDFKNAVKDGHASAVAAGSLFVYHGSRRAVLINYPTQKELLELYKSKRKFLSILDILPMCIILRISVNNAKKGISFIF